MSTDASHQWSHCTGAPNSQAAATANTWNMPGRNSQTYHSMLHFYMCVIFSILFSYFVVGVSRVVVLFRTTSALTDMSTIQKEIVFLPCEAIQI